jgi:DNA-binding PadR family transcriptional regulator
MAVLARTPGGLHGYLISQRLRDVAIFSDSPPDTAGLYRLLKAMEKGGHLKSEWDVEGSGPHKRVYVLTDSGYDCLRRWVNTLESYSKTLQRTVKFIKQSMTLRRDNKGKLP